MANTKLVEETELPQGINLTRVLHILQVNHQCDRDFRDLPSTVEGVEEQQEKVAAKVQKWGYDHVKLFRTERGTTFNIRVKDEVQAAVLHAKGDETRPSEIVVTFSGSNGNIAHFFRNMAYAFMVKSGFGEGYDVHKGFNDSLHKKIIGEEEKTLLDAVMEEIEAIKQLDPEADVTFAGHSAGGSISSIAASHWLERSNHNSVHQIITFGAPRVGGEAFKDELQARIGTRNILRFELDGDPVPALPPWGKFSGRRYRHAGTWIPFTHSGALLRRENPDADPIETTSHYDIKLSKTEPHWEDLENPDGQLLNSDDEKFRASTRQWHAFARGGFKSNHLLTAYYKGINALAKRQRDKQGTSKTDWRSIRSRVEFTQHEANELYTHFSILEDMLSHAYIYPTNGEEAAMFNEAKQTYNKEVGAWPNGVSVHYARHIENALDELLERMPDTEKNEPYRNAKGHAQATANLVKQLIASKQPEASVGRA